MSIFSCLDQAPTDAQSLLDGDGLFNTVSVLLILSVAVIAIASPLIARAYRNRITRLMALNQVEPRPAAWWKYHDSVLSQHSASQSQEGLNVSSIKTDALAWESRIMRASVSAWLAFVVFGLLVADWSIPDAFFIDRLSFALFAGLLAAVPVFINLPEPWKRKTLIKGLITLVVIALVMEYIEQPGMGFQTVSEDNGPLDWGDAVAMAIFLPIYVALFHHRLRGLIFPVSVVLSVIILTFTMPFLLFEEHLGSCLSEMNSETSSESGLANQQLLKAMYSTIGVGLVMLGLWLGFMAVGALARLVEKGWLSDLSLVSFIGLTLISILVVFEALPENASDFSAWLTWVPLLWVAVPVSVYALVLGKRPTAGSGQSLLVLRVFSKDKKQQFLLNQIQQRWRYIGAVNQAGGPDLVDLNVDPYECAMFLSGRLYDLYLPAAVSAEQLLGRLNHEPDREGRYRINEMFNFNTAWRNNVEQLILLSETILLDLRGLTSEREGTSFEIGLLAKNKMLSRVVAIGDDQTDWDHVGHQLSKEGQSLEQIKRVDIASDKDLDELISELLKVSVRAT